MRLRPSLRWVMAAPVVPPSTTSSDPGAARDLEGPNTRCSIYCSYPETHLQWKCLLNWDDAGVEDRNVHRAEPIFFGMFACFQLTRMRHQTQGCGINLGRFKVM